MKRIEERWQEIMLIALANKASDIHLTKRENASLVIEIRSGGLLKKLKSKRKDERLIPYLQYVANLDLGNSYKPQTGQFEMYLNQQTLSLRFAYLKRPCFINAVVRILNDELPVDGFQLSLLKSQNQLLQKYLNAKAGLILFAGPTGSGKTTSLYALLKTVKNKKIYTLEDPIEHFFSEFMQWQINEKSGFNYKEGIKQLLRHDPDIVLIGEIRDEMAALAAIRMAETGHLVFASIHSASSKMAIERMLDLGVNKQALYDILLLVSCQRMFVHKQRIYVLYELMQESDIAYYAINHCYQTNFLSLNKQIKSLEYSGYK